jgi:hypothetical protein
VSFFEIKIPIGKNKVANTRKIIVTKRHFEGAPATSSLELYVKL